MRPRASFEPSKLLRDEGPREPQYNQRPSQLGPPYPRAVVDTHERKAGVLVDQEDVDEAVNKPTDSHLQAEVPHERVEKAERTTNEIRQSNRELLQWLRDWSTRFLDMRKRGRNRGRCRRRVEHSGEGDQLMRPSIRHRNQSMKRRWRILLQSPIVERR